MPRFFCGLMVALALLVGALRADADPSGSALLQRGIDLNHEAAYSASVTAIQQARATHTLEHDEQIEAAFYLASDYVALGSIDAARAELRQLLTESPAYELPAYTSPKVTSLFKEVKEQLARQPRLKALTPVRRGARLELRFEVLHAQGTPYGSALWRWRGQSDYGEAPLHHANGLLVAELAVAQAGTLEYYATVRGAAGLMAAGTPARPLTFSITPAEVPSAAMPSAHPGAAAPSVVKSWWFWTAVGLVAATGLGVGLYYGLRPANPPTGDAVLTFDVH